MATTTWQRPTARVDATTAREETNSNRKTAALVGALFLVATATFLVSSAVITPILGSGGDLAAVGRNSTLVIAAALIALIDGLAVVGIAAALYPILSPRHPGLAVAYTGMRTAELAIIAAYVLAPLMLVSLSRSETAADSATMAALLLGLRHWTLLFIYLFNGVAGLVLTYMLLRTRLVPRALPLVGLVGYAALFVGASLDALGFINTAAGAGMVALVPGGLFELALPIWLFVRGFRPTR
jgi:MFS family permease